MSIFWPNEIVKKPRPLVVLTGLNIDENPVHKSIWEGFAKIRRQDRASLNIKLNPIKHEYPKCKNKRVSYEWYVPKGILKSSWMHKHMEELPSLVVFFFDLDWDDIHWREKINECASVVNIIRRNIQGRLTKVVVVLVQKRVLMPGEDNHTEQKAQMMCQACEFSGNRSLFMLPTTESMFGYITRLEKEFQDLARDYYNGLIKKVKSHRENLNKTTHLLLFIRHQFKIGFYLEFRQDPTNALKNYKYAYTFLTELRLLDTHLLEIKTVAGYINYKICCLSFQNNASDAINQFRTHIDIFKGVSGNPELAFEHESWISKQFEVMGDLFRDAIRQGLTAITTQNPALYYEEAALHAIVRKSLSHASMLNKTSARNGMMNRYYRVQEISYIPDDIDDGNNGASMNTDSLYDILHNQIEDTSQPHTEFYGQRVWRQGKQSIEIGDPVKEKEAISILRKLEKKQDHSKIIIPLLKSTIEHFQKYKANRMKLLSYVLMGEEYISAGDYSQALKCFSKVIFEYRMEKWNCLLLPALLNYLKCTYMIANVSEYISVSLELITIDNLLKEDQKERIQNNIKLVLQNEVPNPEPELKSENIEQAQLLWKDMIKEFIYVIKKDEYSIVNMDGINSSIDCKVRFSQNKANETEKVEFIVYLRSTTNLALELQNIEVKFTEPKYNSRYHLIQNDEHNTKFPLIMSNTEQVYAIYFYVNPISEESSLMIKIEKIRILLGSLSNFGHAMLEWSINYEDCIRQTYIPRDPIEFCTKQQTQSIYWLSIIQSPSIELTSRESNFDLKICHADPVLVNEYHIIEIELINNEDILIDIVNVSVKLEESPSFSSKVRFNKFIRDKPMDSNITLISETAKKVELELRNVQPKQLLKKKFAITATSTGKISIILDINYKIKIDIDEQYSNLCVCTKSESISTSIIEPFEVLTKLMSTFMIPMSDIEVNEPFLLQITCSNITYVNIKIQKTEILLNENVVLIDDQDEYDDRLKNETVNSLEAACEVFMLKVPRNINEEYSYIPVGKYVIYWKRLIKENDEDKEEYNKTTITIPDCSLDLSPLSIDLDIDAQGICQIPMTITYTIRNKTLYPLEVETQLEMTDNFMFSGIKQQQVRVLPHSLYPLRFCLLPLIPGFLPLPKLHIRQQSSSTSSYSNSNIDYHNTDNTARRRLEDKLLARLPSTIFVKPMGSLCL